MTRFKHFLLMVLLMTFLTSNAAASTSLYCIADRLNGREKPTKNSGVGAYFEYGEELEVVGYEGDWVEVVGGETGTVFVSAQYVASSLETTKYKNVSSGRVIVRDAPNGNKKKDYVKTKKTVTISAIIDDWGYIKNRGWVCLEYFEEVEEE